MTPGLKSVTSITYLSMCILLMMGAFDSLRGHYSLKTASEVKSDYRFESVTPITYLSMGILLI